jgi:hypothetical protein
MPNKCRYPKGHPKGGQFAPEGAAAKVCGAKTPKAKKTTKPKAPPKAPTYNPNSLSSRQRAIETGTLKPFNPRTGLKRTQRGASLDYTAQGLKKRLKRDLNTAVEDYPKNKPIQRRIVKTRRSINRDVKKVVNSLGGNRAQSVSRDDFGNVVIKTRDRRTAGTRTVILSPSDFDRAVRGVKGMLKKTRPKKK